MRRSVSNSPNTKLELERALQAKRVAQVLAETEISASTASNSLFLHVLFPLDRNWTFGEKHKFSVHKKRSDYFSEIR